MNAALPRARHYLAQGEYKKAADALWLVERDARSGLAEATELVDLARTLRDATSGGLNEQANDLLGYGQQHVARLTREVEGTTQTGGDVPRSGGPWVSLAAGCAVVFCTALVGAIVGGVVGRATENPSDFIPEVRVLLASSSVW